MMPIVWACQCRFLLVMLAMVLAQKPPDFQSIFIYASGLIVLPACDGQNTFQFIRSMPYNKTNWCLSLFDVSHPKVLATEVRWMWMRSLRKGWSQQSMQ